MVYTEVRDVFTTYLITNHKLFEGSQVDSAVTVRRMDG
jgi:hypothetical protein